MKSFEHYHPFIAAFTITIGLGLFGGIAYAQRGGFVTDVSKLPRTGTTVLEEPISSVPYSTVEELPVVIDVPEVTITASPRQTRKMQSIKQSQKILQCVQRELEQGGRQETPTVKACEWITLP